MMIDDKTEQEEILIRDEYQCLINDYLNSNHRRKVEIIDKAFHLAKEAHQGARRRSGEPYILHPIAVARIVCREIGLGSTSICSALLHDVVEDTEYTVEDIRELFGDKVAQIVDGLTKISSGMFGKDVSSQAENFRKLLLTMSDDIRVILVKIADRLHNMRTLGSMAPNKQYKIAGETMYIYAPLAHRLGLFTIKTELEELSFKWENPSEYEAISKQLKETYSIRAGIYERFAAPVIEKLDSLGYHYEIKARDKSVYSIWNKMQNKKVSFDQIYDIFAVRIIFDCEFGENENRHCWDIYSAITDIYKLRPDRIRDWVIRPKANGYQALHLTVMGPDGQWIEIQIRSRRMDDIAEKGFAAHWKYKDGKEEEDAELGRWLQTIQEILENPNPNALDFLDTIKLNLYSQEIFVFTTKGEIRTLAYGATALDFAYELHTEIGDHCIGAKVNHKLEPLSHVLASGDQIEIITSKSQVPKAEWLNFIVTAKAKNKIEYAIRRQRREIVKQGEMLLKDSLVGTSFELSASILDRILDYYQKNNKEELFYAIGNHDIDLPQKIKKLLTTKKYSPDSLLSKYLGYTFFRKNSKKSRNLSSIYTIDEIINPKKTYILSADSFKKNFSIAPCCSPIPGDNVFGFIKSDNKVDVHDLHCPIGLKLKAAHGDKIVNLEWGNMQQLSSFSSVIEIIGIDRLGILRDIATVVSEHSIHIREIALKTNDGVFEGKVDIYISDMNRLESLCSKISKIEGVSTVNRVQQKYDSVTKKN